MAQAVINEIFDTQNPLIRLYFFYVSVLALKMLLMSLLTSTQRIKNKAFVNPEDAVSQKVKVKISEDVERVRSTSGCTGSEFVMTQAYKAPKKKAHLNDVENIPVFFVASFAYLLTNPSVTLATLLFRVFTIARIGHTLVYAIYVIPQPARGLCWMIGYAITAYMAGASLWHFLA